MTLIEQAIQAEQEYKIRMKEATDRLKHIQGYLGHIYVSEEIIGVESVSIKDDMVHLDVRWKNYTRSINLFIKRLRMLRLNKNTKK